MQFPACDLILHVIVHSKERTDECTVCGLCLASTAAVSAAIVVYRAIAAVFAVSVVLPLDYSVL